MPAPVYVYGIVRLEDGTWDLSPVEGLAGATVGAIVSDGLAALASTLPVGTLFTDSLADPEEAKRMVLAHHAVLQWISQERTVLPMRFGALFADDTKVRDVLREHRGDLSAALERVHGAREWGVKIFCDRSMLSEHLGETSPAMRAAQGELAAAAQGRAFFLQRRIARLKEEELEGAISRHVEEGCRRLRAAARDEAAIKHQPAAVHGRADDMVWNGAYLVAKSGEEGFFGLIDELRQAHAPRGFCIETNGPWPPFSFADCRLVDETNDHSNGA